MTSLMLVLSFAFAVASATPAAAQTVCTSSSGVLSCPGVVVSFGPIVPGQPVAVTVTLPDGITLPDGTVIPPGGTVTITLLIASTPIAIFSGPQQLGTTQSYSPLVPASLAPGPHTGILEINGQVVATQAVVAGSPSSPVAAPTTPGKGGVAFTGAEVAGLTGFAVALIVIGLIAVAGTRRRRTTEV